MVRQSKPYFDEEPMLGQVVRERGIYFCGFMNSAHLITKMCENQIANSDSLLKFLNTIYGGILYVPNLV